MHIRVRGGGGSGQQNGKLSCRPMFGAQIMIHLEFFDLETTKMFGPFGHTRLFLNARASQPVYREGANHPMGASHPIGHVAVLSINTLVGDSASCMLTSTRC